MSGRNGDRSWNPTAEELAAFADGALDPVGPGLPLRQRIEDWLTDHPGAAAEVAAQRRLNRLMQQTAAPDPGETAWAALWERINQPPVPALLKRPPSRGRWAWPAAVLLAAAVAASLVIAVLAPGPQGGPAPEEVEPLAVVSADEVEIIRMSGADADVLVVGEPPVAEILPVAQPQEVDVVRVNGADTGALVVGEPPVTGPLVLANPGEVTLIDIDPADDDTTDVHMGAQDVPMIWARLDEEVGKTAGS
jgi:hypothetical protein